MPGAAEWATVPVVVAAGDIVEEEQEVVEVVVAAGTEEEEGMGWHPAVTERPLPATMIGEWYNI